ncbi:MAG TPA: sigma-70 family RNA polymerase sigma factor [Planctomycetota bacterium]
MPDPLESDLELRQHAAALRCLARDLLRDPHAADDVTQQTLHRAITARPPEAGPLGGWLYRTLVNFTRQWRRTERRRAARQSQLQPPEPVCTPLDTLSRRETLLSVTNAVLGLDEPYQTAIFLRYFEDLPPRAICKRTGANLATVKSRLQRGLTMLRARLDRRSGDRRDWRVALLSTFGLPLPTAAAGLTLTTGAWLLGTTTKTLIAAGLLCAGGVFAFTLGQDPPPLPADLARRSDAPGATPATSAAGGTTDATVREAAVETPAAALSWLEHPYLLQLDVLVVDETGLPVEGHTMRLSPPGCTMNDAKQATGPDGRAALGWRSRLPTGEVLLADERGAVRRVQLEHGRRVAVALVKPQPKARSTELALKVQTRLVSQSQSGLAIEFLDKVGARGSGAGMQGGLHPHAVFADNAAAGQPQDKREAMASRELSLAYSAWGAKRQMAETASAEVPGQSTARVAGTVFGEDGKPVAGAPVALLAAGPQPLQRTKTDDAGSFVFETLMPGEFTVRAGGASAGLATLPVVTTTGTTPATLHLRRDSCVRGQAQDAAGKPLAGASIVWLASDGSWCDSTETAADGSFVLANLPASAGTVMLWEPTGKFPLPVSVQAKVLSGTADLLLKFDGAVSALQFDLGLPEGANPNTVMARVWNLDTGIGTRMKRPEAGKSWRIANLPAAWYRVEVFAPGSGWLDLGRHWLDGKSDCNLGGAVVPAAATAKLGLDPNALPVGDQQVIELYEVRGDVDVRLDGVVLKPDSELRLPAGDYALAWRSRDGAAEFQRFAVRSGEKVELTGRQ